MNMYCQVNALKLNFCLQNLLSTSCKCISVIIGFNRIFYHMEATNHNEIVHVHRRNNTFSCKKITINKVIFKHKGSGSAQNVLGVTLYGNNDVELCKTGVHFTHMYDFSSIERLYSGW